MGVTAFCVESYVLKECKKWELLVRFITPCLCYFATARPVRICNIFLTGLYSDKGDVRTLACVEVYILKEGKKCELLVKFAIQCLYHNAAAKPSRVSTIPTRVIY